ncbi:ParA family protein [Persicobacter psychrovividus]|uniref:Sporulation initiation inhibitor Soj n=1 Tax=Persicobacter psychrovividus TaxID=387638 RepID=A0ABM7VMF4_9BACT|nr:sporulation initiation inhibitor Soj [Persicobacter psychrovividus]
MSQLAKIKQFFEEREAISVSAIEKEAKLSKGRLRKILIGEGAMTPLVINRLRPVLENYGFSLGFRSTTISFYNYKGGVGKTTSVLSIGACLAKLGYKVLLVDFDGQANLTRSCGFTSRTRDIFAEEGPQVENYRIVQSGSLKRRIDLITSDIALHEREKDFGNRMDYYELLDKKLQKFKDEYDFILIDNCPGINDFPKLSIMASDYVMIPTQAEWDSIAGIPAAKELLEVFKEEKNRTVPLLGVFVTMYSNNQVAQEISLEELQNAHGDNLMKTIIPRNTAIQQARLTNKDILRYSRASDATKAYMELTEEMLRKLGFDKDKTKTAKAATAK